MCVDEMLECIRIAFKHRKVLLEEDKDKAEKMIDELQKLYIQREGVNIPSFCPWTVLKKARLQTKIS